MEIPPSASEPTESRLKDGNERTRDYRGGAFSMLAPTTGTEGIPTILQQVRIGNAPLVPDTGMTPPIALVHPAPAYTAEALQQNIEGKVTVRAEFDIDGNVTILEVIEGLGYGLDEAALAVLEDWRFRPAYRNGRRVAVVANIDVEFRPPLRVRGLLGVSGIGASFLGLTLPEAQRR
jgi:TonB family protein